MEFHRPIVEEAERVARIYRGKEELSVGAAQTEAGRLDTFRCCARCAKQFFPEAPEFITPQGAVAN
eukprot:11226272-Lingulodinium_polyedra.AAC.1